MSLTDQWKRAALICMLSINVAPLAGWSQVNAQVAQANLGVRANAAPQVAPTDITGSGGGLFYARGPLQGIFGLDINTLPPSDHVIVARDCRYNFTGRWSSFAPTGVVVAHGSGILTYSAVLPESGVPTEGSFAPRFMPSASAIYAIAAPDRMQLSDGAVVIKAGEAPVYVSGTTGGESVTVEVQGGGIFLISMLSGKLTVLNLADKHQNSAVVYLSDKTRGRYGFTPVRIGQMVEVYPTCAERADNELLAYQVLSRVALNSGLTVETMRVNYPKSLKRFQLTYNLPSPDLNWILKSAAAVSYVDSGIRVYNYSTVIP